MRKILAMLLGIILICSLAACKSNKNSTSDISPSLTTSVNESERIEKGALETKSNENETIKSEPVVKSQPMESKPKESESVASREESSQPTNSAISKNSVTEKKTTVSTPVVNTPTQAQSETTQGASTSSPNSNNNNTVTNNNSNTATNNNNSSTTNKEEPTKAVRIKLSFNNKEIIVKMNDSPSSADFVKKLPMTLTFKDYGGTEKISYLYQKLSTIGTSSGYDPSVGDLAYFAPWGNICFYYHDFGYSTGLIPLGSIESGMESLTSIDGNFTVSIEKY